VEPVVEAEGAFGFCLTGYGFALAKPVLGGEAELVLGSLAGVGEGSDPPGFTGKGEVLDGPVRFAGVLGGELVHLDVDGVGERFGRAL
jgi:hypothetical protein